MRIAAAIKSGFEHFLGLIYPRNCTLSGRPLDPDHPHWVHPEALKDLKEIHHPLCLKCGRPHEGSITSPYQCANCSDLRLAFRSARAYARTSGSVREVIHRFKYGQNLWLGDLLGEWICRGWRNHYADLEADLLVPVPLHPRKWRERGYNQAEVLARSLSKETGIPVGDVLFRVRDSASQTAFDRKRRLENLRGCLRSRDKIGLQDRLIVLIDDVLTTGATAHECARVLRKAGAREVAVLTVARG